MKAFTRILHPGIATGGGVHAVICIVMYQPWLASPLSIRVEGVPLLDHPQFGFDVGPLRAYKMVKFGNGWDKPKWDKLLLIYKKNKDGLAVDGGELLFIEQLPNQY
jgi:hypothetical protein